MSTQQTPAEAQRGGRSVRWRLGMLATGTLVGGYGAALLLWPQILIWTIAGVFLLAGLGLVASALLARGRA